MQITLDNFKKLIKPGGLHKVGLHAIGRVHGITQKFYCNNLTTRSACSQDCEACIVHLRDRLNRADWASVKTSYGLYTYILKDASAAAVEAMRSTQKALPVVIAFEDQVEALDTLLETFA